MTEVTGTALELLEQENSYVGRLVAKAQIEVRQRLSSASQAQIGTISQRLSHAASHTSN